jgi:cytochrome c556
MKRPMAAAVILALTTSFVFADAIEDRQALMKGVAAATKTGAALAKGDAPFDAAKAKEVLQVYVNASEKLPTLVPPDSTSGHDTTASPKIWEDMAGFKAAAAKLGADAKDALAKADDQAGFAAGFGAVTKNCNACHGTYRIKKG